MGLLLLVLSAATAGTAAGVALGLPPMAGCFVGACGGVAVVLTAFVLALLRGED